MYPKLAFSSLLAMLTSPVEVFSLNTPLTVTPKPDPSCGGMYSTHFILKVSPVFSSADLATGYERYLSFPLFLPLSVLFVNFD